MRRTLLICLFAAIATVSCKKLIEDKQKQFVLNAMTNGRWFVELYKVDTANVTPGFTGYEFQFYENNKVDAIYSGTTKSTGTWNADVTNYSITANFPTEAGDTLRRLNYVWTITDSYTDYVEAKTSVSGKDNILHLRKK